MSHRFRRKLAEKALAKSQDLLQTIIDTSPLRIFWKDRESRYLGCNSAFARDAGENHPDDLIGKDDYQLGWKAQAQLYRADDRQIMDSGISKLFYEEPQTTPDGHQIWLRTSKVPLRDQTNNIIGVLGIYEDITSRKQAEAQLKNSEERYRQIIRTSMDGFWIADTMGRILDVNDAYCRLTGYTREELLDMRVTDVEAKESAEETAQHIREIMAQGHARFETRHRRKDGQLLDIEVSTVYQPAPEGDHLFVFLRDITGRKQAEALERKRFNELQAIYLISNATCGADSLDQIYENAMESILRVLKADRVSILLFGTDGRMHFKTWRNLSDTYRKAADGHSPWAQDAVDPHCSGG